VKFQPATSITPAALWCGAGLVVLLTGEAARQSAWPFLTVAAAAALTLALVARLQPGAGERAQAIGLGAVAAALIIAAILIGHTRFHAGSLQDEAVAAAMARRERILASSIAAAKHTAFLALDRIGDRPAALTPDLADLVSNGEIETSIAVIRGDTILDVAGAQRMEPDASPAPAALVSTPFARLLVVRETRARRQAQVVLLLDSLPGLPVAGRSLAEAAGDGVLWRWTTADNGTIEYPSTDAAVAGIDAAMRPVPAPFDTFLVRTAGSARLLVAAGLLIAALVTLLTSVYPLVRAGAVILPLSALSRSGVGTVLFGPNAVRTVLVATALLFLAIELWRRPARRTVVGMVAALLLLGTAPPLVVLLARALVPHGEELPLLPSFGWEMIVALATGALLAVAMAPLRALGDDDASSRWGVAAAIASILVGLIGIEAWSPGTPPVAGSWAAWYPPLWLVPVALLLPLTRPRVRLVALATAAGVLASLATWATTVDRRIELAAADLARLTAPSDSATLAALDQFAIAARANHATRLDRLYATWGASQLAAEGVPTYLSLWSAEGHQREFVALDSLKVSWDDLAPLVREASAEPRHFGLSGRVGHHEVLILPLAPDTIATVTVGPRSRLLVPTTFGLLVGWRSSSSMPPFSDSVVTTGDPSSQPDASSVEYVGTSAPT
jgi:hypothetical protein